jgi:hypothetical protein
VSEVFHRLPRGASAAVIVAGNYGRAARSLLYDRRSDFRIQRAGAATSTPGVSPRAGDLVIIVGGGPSSADSTASPSPASFATSSWWTRSESGDYVCRAPKEPCRPLAKAGRGVGVRSGIQDFIRSGNRVGREAGPELAFVIQPPAPGRTTRLGHRALSELATAEVAKVVPVLMATGVSSLT